MSSRAWLVALCVFTASAFAPGRFVAMPTSARQRVAPSIVMGRKFENNKLKMAKTAAAYTKKASYIGKKIVMAVKAGGPNPDANRALGLVIKEAQALDVGKDVVTRNIKKASETDTGDFKELTYEAYGSGGVGFIINVLSDNNNRAVEQVGTAVKKSKTATMSTPGSVSFQFERRGRLAINAELDEEALIELAINAGVEDVARCEPDEVSDGDAVKTIALVGPTELAMMQEALQEAGHDCTARLANIPSALIEVSEEDLEANLAVIDRLEECDDVDFVEHNMVV